MPPSSANDNNLDPANDNRVSPFAWLFFIVALVCDLAKGAVFFVQLIPAVGIPLSVVLSFYISVVEVVVVFGGLWMVGIYKSPKNSNAYFLLTLGVSAADLVPEIDDFPFTTPTVFYMIVKAYASSGSGILGGLAKIGGAVAGAASAVGGAAGKAAGGLASSAGGARVGGSVGRALPKPSASPATSTTHQHTPSPQRPTTGAPANDNPFGGNHGKAATPMRTRTALRPPPQSSRTPEELEAMRRQIEPRRNKYGMRLPPEAPPPPDPSQQLVRARGRGR